MNRDESVRQIEERGVVWDIVVIGGGASGLGAAVDAASRGYKTLLLEQSDFAKGTSSRSTKLIHGGVRYLRQGNVGLVIEGLRERGLLLRNAPHLVHRRGFVVPAYSRWDNAIYAAGLKMYDLLAGRLSLGKSQRLTAAQTLAQVPNLRSDGLRGSVLYWDGQFDDARLAINLAQTLADLGGTPLNYFRVAELIKTSGRICGVRAVDLETGKEHPIPARAVINAAGVFCDRIINVDQPGARPLLTLSQGTHVVLERRWLPGDMALMVPRTDDARVLFAIPWQDRVLVGTTDTPVDDAAMEPRPLEQEIDFLLQHVARYLNGSPSRKDVTSVFTGLRPLLRPNRNRGTAAISRDFTVTTSAAGLVTVAGGKWTIYRRMGEACVNRAAEVAGLDRRESRTRQTRVHGWTEASPSGDPLTVYGTDATSIQAIIQSERQLGDRLHSRLPYQRGQVIWSARDEMARTVEDVLARRTRALFLDAQASVDAAPAVASLLGTELGRGADWQEEQVRLYSKLASGYRLS
jgi:glycerol-3-phosphate dehydrogenase